VVYFGQLPATKSPTSLRGTSARFPENAVEALVMAAEGRGPVMHSRIGVKRALNRNVERRRLLA
jgi:hypothetical protein